MTTYLIVDGLNLFMRHYVAHPSMNNNGDQVGGVIGFLYTIVNFVEKYKPDRIYVVWESGGSPRRRSIQKDYKMKRRPQKLNRNYEDLPDTVDNRNYQIGTLTKVMSYMPICQIYVPDCEADDVIGYLCKNRLRNDRKVIISSDKDYYQLIDKNTIIYSPTWKKLVTSKEVIQKYSIDPTNFSLAKCAVGDISDNIRGIKGAGFKTLAKRYPMLLERKDVTIQDIKVHSGKMMSEGSKVKIYKSIFENIDILKKNWKLVYLDTANIAGHQAQKILETIDTFKPVYNKIKSIRFFIQEGIDNFNFNRAFLAFSSIRVLDE